MILNPVDITSYVAAGNSSQPLVLGFSEAAGCHVTNLRARYSTFSKGP